VTQILFLVEPDDVDIAMTGLRAGSFQYAKLPIEDEELRLLLDMAVERQPQYGENLLLREKGGPETSFEQLIGRSEAMQGLYQQMRQAAATSIPVLIIGETGTGKDLVAQAIHAQSDRAAAVYAPVHLGALPQELVASELFGHERGAFTGAHGQRKGQFELAHGGTVFIDEIVTIDERVQVALLRIIEQKQFSRLGGEEILYSDARIITATNEDLWEAVQRGAFREDLYYRLDVFHIEVPPLRQRTGDIPLLMEEFLRRFNAAFQKNILHIAPDLISMLECYAWPGNVRELKNVVQRAVLVCSGDTLMPEHVPPRLQNENIVKPRISFELGTSLDEVERQMVVQALALARNRTQAAELLGISRRALYNKIKKHRL
ncbi:MAG: sigma-54-dependent Fis family transcriptional regulator, partial [Candidatus Hydrogenedentes bacterium]|nr:sigma-54-dependent Fis family transcriptional regulator [Candidatus Hydrogenedentota bacterium]